MKQAVGLDDLADVAPEVHASLVQLLTLPADVLDGMALVFQVRGGLGDTLDACFGVTGNTCDHQIGQDHTRLTCIRILSDSGGPLPCALLAITWPCSLHML